jgi:hypothetical protein
MKNDKYLQNWMKYLYDIIKPVNDSKIFAGIVVLTINLLSKMISLPTSRTIEAVIKHSFSRYILVFAIAWMGTRDIVISFIVCVLFAVCVEFLFNEKSSFCCLTESFVETHIQKLESFEGNPHEVTKEELDSAMKIIEKAQRILKDSKVDK